MDSTSASQGRQEERLAAYLDRLANAAGHADRAVPLKHYCTALLLPGERKSVEPLAARLAPENLQRLYESLHHLVAKAPWSDETILSQVRNYVLEILKKKSRILAWIVDDIQLPKHGPYSVGVTRRPCGDSGNQAYCQVAVSLLIAASNWDLPIAWRLYLPESWAGDRRGRRRTGVPEEIKFQAKPGIGLEQIRRAVETSIPRGIVLAGPDYGIDTQFREAVAELGLHYVLGVRSETKVWWSGKQALLAGPPKATGHRRMVRRQVEEPRIVSVKELALTLPPSAWMGLRFPTSVEPGQGSRFAKAGVRSAHREYWKADFFPKEWLVIEWPQGKPEPINFWLSNLPPEAQLKDMTDLTPQRFFGERAFRELKQELGLGHYEGRGWRGFHHHATLCTAAYGFLVAERNRFSPSARAGYLRLPIPKVSPDFRPRGSPPLSRMAQPSPGKTSRSSSF
jgi:SRSO17 transposase